MYSEDKEYEYITDNNHLQATAQYLTKEPFIALDTEFIRQNTYFPICCLIQFASPNYSGIIDPFITDASIFLNAIEDITKVFHDAKQDLECLKNISNIKPETIFDTQIAEMFLNFHESKTSYKTLVKNYCNVTLNKSYTTANWRKRPLDHEMLKYAIHDVTYLREIYTKQLDNLQKLNRYEFYKEYALSMFTESNKIEKQPATLKDAILAWRLSKAILTNTSANKILHITAVSELIKRSPRNIKEFYLSQNYSIIKLSKQYALELLDIIATHSNESFPEKTISPQSVPLLKLLLNHNAAVNNVSPVIIANNTDIIDFATTGAIPPCSKLQEKLFWHDANLLLQGKIGIKLDNGEITLIQL